MDRIALNELEYVEEPFLRQLERLKWRIVRGDKYDASVSLREGFNEVIIESELREAIKRINPWIDEDQISEVIREITVPQGNSFIEVNKEILELLLENTSAENRKTGEKSETVRFIDFKTLANNSFLAISQFKVNIPGTEKHIIPDIVLFVNGLPLGIVECKSPYIANPIGEAVTQLMRYSNRRGEKEGNERLFWYNQIMIANSRQSARYSTITGEISDKEAMNKRFEDVFSNLDDETRKNILGRYTWKAYLEAKETIQDKAGDMLDHYLAHIFPNGFKAQVVAVSRVAAMRYKEAFDEALSEKIAEFKMKGNAKIDIAQLEKMQVAVVISGSPNDPPEYHKYTDEQEHERIIESFKLPFGKTSDNNISGDVGIIIVQSMLLTGFDAPVEQVMYLDNVIKEHTLLQAIARVNRVEHNKSCGFVIDYVGVARHLREALAVFDAKDVEEILRVVKSDAKDIDDLKYSYLQMQEFFRKYDIADINDIDACVDILADEETRNEFLSFFKAFTKNMDKVLPKKEALEYVYALKTFGFISQTARNRYRDEKLNIKDASKKVRDIVDEYLVSKGVDPKIPPLPIFSEKFKAKINQEKSDKAKVEELKHAIDEHIKGHQEEDPELYERFSEKLDRLLREYKENWEMLAKELEKLMEEIRMGRAEDETFGFDRKIEMPFLGLLKKEVFGVKNISDLNEKQVELLVQTTKDILERVKSEIRLVDFWGNYTAQKKLKGYIASHLLTAFKDNKSIFKNRAMLSQKILELAFHLHDDLTR